MSLDHKADASTSIPTQFFCPECVDPFDTVEWELRSAHIKDESGGILFEQKNCEIPAQWSTLATNVVVSKYFHGEHGTPQRETSVRQVIHRVARTIADWGIEGGYFESDEHGEAFYRDLAWLCLHQYGAFNSPVWFNVGLFHQYGIAGSKGNYRFNPETQEVERLRNSYEYPQSSACFIQSVDDTMEGIMKLATSEAMLFKHGSGTGTDLSTIRSSKEKLSGGGKPSGPLSFMRVYDQIAAVVKSGGRVRRAAKMQSLKDWHPDILEFIQCKPKEEHKAHVLIASGEYESNFNGEAYGSIMFQNANLSVRLSDDFMKAVEANGKWQTRWVTDPTKTGPEYDARYLLRQIAEGTWKCGDPGVQFDTTINRWHTSSNSGAINASNPCAEFNFLDNTACNLASLNLRKYQKADGTISLERFRQAASIFITAQEILVDNGNYPTPEIAANSHRFRPLGLGYANLGSLLMSMGIPYDSDEGRGICGVLTAIMTGQAYLTSSKIAERMGAFPGFEENREPMMKVMEMHRDAIDGIDWTCPTYLQQEAHSVWFSAVESGYAHGYKNAQVTVLAPTGTLSFMMDCDTTGIEPDIALVKYKQLAGGGMMKITNQTVTSALVKLGYTPEAIKRIVAYIETNDTVEGSEILDQHLPVFDCAFKARNGTRSIKWQGHVGMMAAAQPFLSGSPSKTVNLPQAATVEDIEQVYIESWKLGLKAVAIYRDGSKSSQPLATSTEGDRKKESDSSAIATVTQSIPSRRHLPATRHSLTHKFSVGGHEGYITVGMFEDGTPGELFVTMAKEGSTVGGLMDCIGTLTSMGLQYRVPLEVLINKFSHQRFEPAGWTGNPDIPNAKSLVDYVFRWIGMQFIPGYREENSPQREESEPSNGNGHSKNGHGKALELARESVAKELRIETVAIRNQQFATFQQDAPTCGTCGAITVRNGNCYLCHNCGNSLGCS